MPLTPRPPVSVQPWWQTARVIVFLLALHLLPLAAVIAGTTAADWWIFVVTHLIIAFFVASGLHRYFAHHAFCTSRAGQLVLAVGSCLAFTDPIGFAGKHRIHHRFSDTEGDPHSPNDGWFSCWIWSLADDHLTDAQVTAACPDLMRHAELRWLHRFYWVPGATVAGLYFLWGGFPRMAIGFALALVTALHLTSAVNYACHRWGARPFDTKEGSRNNVLVALITWGEGWHNNHHRYPTAARAGFQWWQVDMNYVAIKLLAALGLVWDVHEVPEALRRPQPLLHTDPLHHPEATS